MEPAATSGKLAAGDWRSGSGFAAGVGRAEVAGGTDAAEYYSGRGGDPAEYAGAFLHAAERRADGAGVWAGAGAKSGAKGFERAFAGQRQRDQRRFPAPVAEGPPGGAGMGGFFGVAGGPGSVCVVLVWALGGERV